MFPFVYGFTWDTANVIFLGIFFSVVAVIGSTIMIAVLRALKDFKFRRQEIIRWESDFHDLPSTARKCRHEITGEFTHRTCDNGFDCRTCATHAKLVAQTSEETVIRDSKEGGNQKMFGFDMPLDRMYHRGHTWVRLEADGTMTVGIDDLGSRLIGTPDAVELPPAGSRLRAYGTGWHMKKKGTDIRVIAPVDGEVVETGGREKGWYLKLKPLGEETDMRHLLRGSEIKPWLMREMERLQFSLAVEGVGPSLADGGEPVKDFSKSYPSADWDAVLGEMFLEP